MIKCRYDICRWPNCNKTCGLVPKEGESNEESLILYLQTQIEDLTAANKALLNSMISIAKTLVQETTPTVYTPVCPIGMKDCRSDPAYIRHYFPDLWETLNCPTKCEDKNCPYKNKHS